MQTTAEKFREINQQIKDAYSANGSTLRKDIELLWFTKFFQAEIKSSENSRTFKVTFKDDSIIEFVNNNLI